MSDIKVQSFLTCMSGIVCGLLISHMLSYTGILLWQSGVDYYAEAHLSFLNSLIHTICMPFTYFGFNLSIPALLHIKDSWNIQLLFFTMYMTHYFMFDQLTALLSTLYYYQSIKLAYKLYMKKITSYLGYILLGFSISTTSLIIQEYYGHYIGGDMPSRLDFYSIFNAILYAKFYAVHHLVQFYHHLY